MTQLVLTHLTLTLPSFGPGALPGRIKSSSLGRLITSTQKRKKKKMIYESIIKMRKVILYLENETKSILKNISPTLNFEANYFLM